VHKPGKVKSHKKGAQISLIEHRKIHKVDRQDSVGK